MSRAVEDSNRRMLRARDAMDRRYAEPLDVPTLARIAHVKAGQPQRKLIVSRTRGYHGVAYGGTSVQGIAPYKENFGPFVDDVATVPAEDIEAVATLMIQRSKLDRRLEVYRFFHDGERPVSA